VVRLADASVTCDRDLVFFHERGKTFDVHGICLDDDESVSRHSGRELLGENRVEIGKHDSIKAV
jgi:hypothetical protein